MRPAAPSSLAAFAVHLAAPGARRLRLGILAAALALLPTLAPARPPMQTRLVAVFLVKEQALNEAMASGRLDDIDGLLSRDFEVRTGDNPAYPVSRTRWLQDAPGSLFPGKIEQLSARAVGTAVLVSFVWVLPGEQGRVAVVDLWDGDDANAHLLVRHATPLGRTRLLPGSHPDGALPKRE